MGIFNKLAKKMSGENDIQNGPVGRGVILGFELTGMSIEVNGVESRVCRFQVQVMLDDTEPYIAACKQRLAVWDIARIQPGATVAAVRVDPADPQRIALDFTIEPPAVRGVRGQGASAATPSLSRSSSVTTSKANPLSSSHASRWESAT